MWHAGHCKERDELVFWTHVFLLFLDSKLFCSDSKFRLDSIRLNMCSDGTILHALSSVDVWNYSGSCNRSSGQWQNCVRSSSSCGVCPSLVDWPLTDGQTQTTHELYIQCCLSTRLSVVVTQCPPAVYYLSLSPGEMMFYRLVKKRRKTATERKYGGVSVY